MTPVRVIEAHTAIYPDPIRLRQGEPLTLDGRRDVWEGHVWLWAVAEDGRSGWVPDSLPASEAGGPRAAFDYDAAELTCAENTPLSALAETHGWTLCRARDGAVGWVPTSKLEPQAETTG